MPAGKCVAVSVFCVFHSTFVNYFSSAYFITNVIWPIIGLFYYKCHLADDVHMFGERISKSVTN